MKLTLYKALCGRWPGGAMAELADALEDVPGTPTTCNTCLNHLERARERGQGWDPKWMRKRSDLSWHVLIRNYADADPGLLPQDAR